MKKKSKSEAGHAKNVSNLGVLVTRCTSYGAMFNPPRAELQIHNLQQLQMEAQMVLRHLSECEARAQDATNNRSEAFKALRPFITRILNSMIACGLSEKTIEDARAIQRRINGTRLSKKTKAENTTANEPTEETTSAEDEENAVMTAPRTVSVSRQSFDLLLEHFSKLILLLQREMNYTPNEADLQLSGLLAHEQHLQYLHTIAITAEAIAQTARATALNK
ncbi:MAG: hypothetical protein IPJ74_27100 [Saprospiraceae bacterium]|nr:hypothetical protein [Saprospiraceae bacterium]